MVVPTRRCGTSSERNSRFPDSTTAYIAVMGSKDIAVINLDDFSVATIENVGRSPRHLVLSPDGDFLYVSRTAKRDWPRSMWHLAR